MQLSISMGAVILAVCLSLSSCRNEKSPPNIIIILSDDQGFGDFTFTGNTYVHTPTLDSLMSQSYFGSATCSPEIKRLIINSL